MPKKKKISSKIVEMTYPMNFKIGDLVASIESSIYPHIIPSLIVLIDEKCENWNVTIELIRHFKAVELEYRKSFDGEFEENDLSPLKIEVE